MAGISDLLNWMDNQRRTVGRNLSDLVRNPKDYLTGVANELPNTVREYAADPMNFVGGKIGGVGMTAWHGSPHKFDKFSLDKIGTGEGAQAYGHGLYFAESPDVAQSYAQSVKANTGELVKRGAAHGLPEDVASNLAAALQSGKSFDPVLDAARKMIDNPLVPAPQRQAAQRLLDHEMPAYNAWSEWSKPGQVYKVDLSDDAIAKMLDWDKPLSQQAPDVQAALEKSKNKQLRAMLDYAKAPYSEMAGGEAKTMGEAFRLLNLNLQGKSSADSAKASALLAKQGIPGIRYLDGGSRSAGQGSSNFVVFDPEMIRILERNGQATGNVPWKPGEYRPLNDLMNVRKD